MPVQTRPKQSFIDVAPHRSFLPLSQGMTAYTLSDACSSGGDLPLVVLVHGFSMAAEVWDDFLPYLKTRCTLTYDLYGRGWSDAVGLNDDKLFTGQLSELLFALIGETGGVSARPIDLIGVCVQCSILCMT